MPRATRPPTLPPDLIDGLANALERVAAVADLLEIVGSVADPGRLRDRTLPGAARVIAEEAERMLALIHTHTDASLPGPAPSNP